MLRLPYAHLISFYVNEFMQLCVVMIIVITYAVDLLCLSVHVRLFHCTTGIALSSVVIV